ncbi:calcium-binding protein [Pseudodonghicola flavimaris]|uniref:Calcium-binding protein n=1 Tax=Pseudodonghicola flavimaris TaxID=3050036 RepID=A0ABT7F5L2_9RHOB|nr:calcium-binding protein [Pseudodonghicola flavimaris]MDK3019694.1 calcium-binding protein [Pseudodonghicola flavimaris]
MAIVSFASLPDDLLDYYIDLNALMRVDAAVSADATTIEASGSYQIFAPPYYTSDASPIRVTLEGDFTYGPLSTVSGTVSTVTLALDGVVICTITDIGGDASAIWAGLQSDYSPSLPILFGDDSITGTDRSDQLQGYDGDDVLHGMAGADTLNGGDGRDTLLGGDGYDYLSGGDGRDRLEGGKNNDNLHGGDGKDVLFGNNGRDYLYGGKFADRLFGGNGNDRLDGDAGNDTVHGGNDNDRLFGGRGLDQLFGDDGDDSLYGDAGDDELTGGSGDDLFIFSRFGTGNKTGADMIMDFETGDGIRLGRVSDADAVVVTQDGDDVLITYDDPEVTNAITVLNALAADVSDAIDTSSWYFY